MDAENSSDATMVRRSVSTTASRAISAGARSDGETAMQLQAGGPEQLHELENMQHVQLQLQQLHLRRPRARRQQQAARAQQPVLQRC